MRELSDRLMGQHTDSSAQASVSAITGQTSRASAFLPTTGPRLRIGLWPIQSESQPEAAMGLATLLGLLLERWSSVRIYRLFAQINDENPATAWNMSLSQFDVDDWQLEDLDENVAIWGRLEAADNGFELKLEVENDLADESDDLYTENAHGTLEAIIAQLPTIAANVADYLSAGEVNPISPAYQQEKWENSALQAMLQAAFDWELHLLLALAGKDWTGEQQIDEYQKLVSVTSQLGDIGSWTAANAAARLMSPLYNPLGQEFAAFIEKSAYDLDSSSTYQAVTAASIYKAGFPLSAIDLLEADVEHHSENVLVWLALAEFYVQRTEYGSALDTYQRAIEANSVSPDLYLRYGDLVAFLEAGNVLLSIGARRSSPTGRSFIERLVLIDPDNTAANNLKWEAVEAYEAVLELDTENLPALSQALMQLADLKDADFWEKFRRLVELDQKSEYLRSVVDTFYNFEDIHEGILILHEAVQKRPDQVETRLSLASAYLLEEESEEARKELNQARKLTDNSSLLMDIDRLMLSVDDPDFEARLGDITERVDAGDELDADDVEYLELALEKAPLFAAGYPLLANAYLVWGETSDALDVLLDGQKQLPDDADIAFALARVLWDEGEAQLALDCLNKALVKNPQHVPLLALIGRFLFEDGQEDEARAFLARAEVINPRHAQLMQVRVYIANQLSGG